MSMKAEMEDLRHDVAIEQREINRLARGLRTRERTRRTAVEVVLLMVLAVGSGLLLWGSSFAHNMVHDQLAAQKIAFPAKGSPALDPKEFPGLQRYAGQAVDNGPKAKAYADQFIATHLKSVAGGKTYSEVSTAAQASPNDAKLQAQAQTLFRGETLRGLLLYAWGWSLVGTIAFWVGGAAFVGALIVLAAIVYALLRPQNA
ncbi:MAG: hypothetical protein JO050_11315 [Acidimicrobiia bacterium]|nr:hypothetical protein [Acidimicrobiia bacterium]